MILLPWEMLKGCSYKELPEEKKEMLNRMKVWWEACTECGQCEEKCPYNLQIIKRKNELMELLSKES
jgi:NAD-dependent dihydropyrimidine dehydrogenase PreA subunit